MCSKPTNKLLSCQQQLPSIIRVYTSNIILKALFDVYSEISHWIDVSLHYRLVIKFLCDIIKPRYKTSVQTMIVKNCNTNYE